MFLTLSLLTALQLNKIHFIWHIEEAIWWSWCFKNVINNFFLFLFKICVAQLSLFLGNQGTLKAKQNFCKREWPQFDGNYLDPYEQCLSL